MTMTPQPYRQTDNLK